MRGLGHEVTQHDLSLETTLRVFSRAGLERLFAAIDESRLSPEVEDIYLNHRAYLPVIDGVVAFAQQRSAAYASRIVSNGFVPPGPAAREALAAADFGSHGSLDHGRHLVAQLLRDLTSLVQTCVDPYFGAADGYGPSVAYFNRFEEVEAALAHPEPVGEMILETADDLLPEDVELIVLVCPSAGTLLASLLLGNHLSAARPGVPRVLCGPFVSQIPRDSVLGERRWFESVDYIVSGDCEDPLGRLCGHAAGTAEELSSTYALDGAFVVWHDVRAPKPAHGEAQPDYRGLSLERYLHVIDRPEVVSRLTAEGTWLKLRVSDSAERTVDTMDALFDQTQLRGFQLVGDAVSSSALSEVALELVRRGRAYQFWAPVTFDEELTPDRCQLFAAAGMIAATGQLDILTDSARARSNLRTTVAQVIKALHALSRAGIMAHGDLVHVMPGQTPQDTIDNLEVVRQLTVSGVLSSSSFRSSQSPRESETVMQRAVLSALRRVVRHYARGERLDDDVSSWFVPRPGHLPVALPATNVDSSYVAGVLSQPVEVDDKGTRLCWLGGLPRWAKGLLDVSCADGSIYSTASASALADHLARCHPHNWRPGAPPSISDFSDLDWSARFRDRGMVLV